MSWSSFVLARVLNYSLNVFVVFSEVEASVIPAAPVKVAALLEIVDTELADRKLIPFAAKCWPL